MNNLNQKTIGIVGGAGPMASCLLNQLVVENLQNKYGCKSDEDFPTIINYSFPFSPMMSTKESESNFTRVQSELGQVIGVLKKERSVVHRHCL